MTLRPQFRSSGSLIADRRHAYAMDLVAEGAFADAAELLEQAMEEAPHWPEGWMALADAREKAGLIASALAALREAARFDDDDRLGASLHIARLDGGPAPSAPPPAYVRDLFDAYAPGFEAALVGRLDYRAPQLIAAALRRTGFRHAARALDLGCGTGLMAPLLRDGCGWLGGVDLSGAMVAEARAKGLYDALHVADVVAALADPGLQGLDLVTAADVFCYLGDLAPVLKAARAASRPGTMLAFSAERLEAGRFTLKDSLRYGHSEDYLREVLAAMGWQVRDVVTEPLRRDRGAAVMGLIVVAVRV